MGIEVLKGQLAEAKEALAQTKPAPMGAPASAEYKAATAKVAELEEALRAAREQAAEADQAEKWANVPDKTYEKNVGRHRDQEPSFKDPDAVKHGSPVHPKG